MTTRRGSGVLDRRVAAVVCAGLLLTLLWVASPVAAQGSDAQCPVPSAPAVGPWEVQQQPIVVVEVDVRNSGDAALLQSLGYACGIPQ